MKKLYLFILLLSLLPGYRLLADEGMWLLPMLEQQNASRMKALGLELGIDEIYSSESYSLKDAIIVFGGGCTGSFISSQGLVLTNHHCGYEYIQQHSTVDRDYLKNGFWAPQREEEIPTPGLSVKQLVSIEDVTEKVLQNVVDTLSEEHRRDSVSAAIQRLVKQADSSYVTEVKPFFSGNSYYCFKYIEYKDVRFVGAPPSSIGKFGADTDNWKWPRHTGDFCLFRVYVAPDGSPSGYDVENVPLIPNNHLRISLAGVNKNDYAMILGYPGSTSRYMTSWGVEQRMKIANQARIDIRGVKQRIWLQDMNDDPSVKLKYATKYAKSSNYYKNSIGMNYQLRRLGVLKAKRDLESEFEIWARKDSIRYLKYGQVLSHLNNAYASREEAYYNMYNLQEAIYSGIEVFHFALKAKRLVSSLELADEKSHAEIEKDLEELGQSFFRYYNKSTDAKVTSALLQTYIKRQKEDRSVFIAQLENKYRSIERYTSKLYKRSLFVSEERFFDFLKNPRMSHFLKDPAFWGASQMMNEYYALKDELSVEEKKILENQRLLEKGLLEMRGDNHLYPDANFTMRLTYGSVKDYSPADAVYYSYFTTLDGVMEKEDSSSWEFNVPSKLKDLYASQDYGEYKDASGKMRVCFITNNDITGGNSGSPVLNGKGELFGLAFDSNWEGMSGDISFESEMQRVVNVDIRYVLFIIDKFAGATHLIEEMEFVP